MGQVRHGSATTTHACNILEPRWTIPILSEMWGGSTRFDEIRPGVGNISTALLSKRLKDIEAHGLIERIEDPATGQVDYVRTQRAIELEPALNALATWAQCNNKARNALLNTDVPTLMWQMRGLVFSDRLPKRQIVMQFRFSDPGLAYDTYWLLTRPGCPTEICTEIPGFEIDLFIETDRISLARSREAAQGLAQDIVGPIKEALQSGKFTWQTFASAISRIARGRRRASGCRHGDASCCCAPQ